MIFIFSSFLRFPSFKNTTKSVSLIYSLFTFHQLGSTWIQNRAKMSLEGLSLLQSICHPQHSYQQQKNGNSSSSINTPHKLLTTSSSIQQQTPNQHPSTSITTLREAVFNNGKRVLKPLSGPQSGNSNNNQKNDEKTTTRSRKRIHETSSSSRSTIAIVKKEPTRAELLDELARRVAAGEEVSELVAKIKKLPQ